MFDRYLENFRRFHKPFPGGLRDPVPEAAGKKGGRHKNVWREPRRAGSMQHLPPRPYSEVHHNENPLNVVFLDDQPKAVSCRQCGVQFPRRNKTIPYDIVLSHQEKWLYPDPKRPSHTLTCYMRSVTTLPRKNGAAIYKTYPGTLCFVLQQQVAANNHALFGLIALVSGKGFSGYFLVTMTHRLQQRNPCNCPIVLFRDNFGFLTKTALCTNDNVISGVLRTFSTTAA